MQSTADYGIICKCDVCNTNRVYVITKHGSELKKFCGLPCFYRFLVCLGDEVEGEYTIANLLSRRMETKSSREWIEELGEYMCTLYWMRKGYHADC